MIALPWLVLSLTGDALAVGTVMAMAGIPRALFMLVGGALTDRFTPRKLMISSNLVRMVLTGLLAVLVATNLIQTWMLYALALFSVWQMHSSSLHKRRLCRSSWAKINCSKAMR